MTSGCIILYSVLCRAHSYIIYQILRSESTTRDNIATLHIMSGGDRGAMAEQRLQEKIEKIKIPTLIEQLTTLFNDQAV